MQSRSEDMMWLSLKQRLTDWQCPPAPLPFSLFHGLFVFKFFWLHRPSSWIELSGIRQARLMGFTCTGMAHAVPGRQCSSVRLWVAALDMASQRQAGSCLLSSCCPPLRLYVRAGKWSDVLCYFRDPVIWDYEPDQQYTGRFRIRQVSGPNHICMYIVRINIIVRYKVHQMWLVRCMEREVFYFDYYLFILQNN